MTNTQVSLEIKKLDHLLKSLSYFSESEKLTLFLTEKKFSKKNQDIYFEVVSRVFNDKTPVKVHCN